MTDNQKILYKIIAIILLTGLLYFALSWRTAVLNKQQRNLDDQTDQQQDVDGIPDAIVVLHTYAENIHTFTGEVDLPTPCHTLTTDVTVAESFPEQVHIALNVFDPPADMICAQVITAKEFKAEFEASPSPIIRATYNGEWVPLVIEDKSGTFKPVSGQDTN